MLFEKQHRRGRECLPFPFDLAGIRRINYRETMKCRFERRRIRFEFRNVEFIRLRTQFPRAMVFIPPLIGGNLAQQVRCFRKLAACGYDLASFTYSGHGKSTGRFSLDVALTDTVRVLDHVRRLCRIEGLPLSGIGSCAAAIPLLYAAAARPQAFSGLVLINAVTRIRLTSILGSLLTYYRVIFRRNHRRYTLADVIRSYFEFMLPEVVRTQGAFGELAFRRIKPVRIFFEILAWNPLKRLSLDQVPVLCLYGREDRILKLYEAGCESRYRARITRLCPKVRFVPLEGDHFLSRPEVRFGAISEMSAFLGDCSNSPAVNRKNHGKKHASKEVKMLRRWEQALNCEFF